MASRHEGVCRNTGALRVTREGWGRGRGGEAQKTVSEHEGASGHDQARVQGGAAAKRQQLHIVVLPN